MHFENLSWLLDFLGLADFIRSAVKEKQRVALNEEALGGREWQIGGRTERGLEKIAISLTSNTCLCIKGSLIFKGVEYYRILSPTMTDSFSIKIENGGGISDSDREIFKERLKGSIEEIVPLDVYPAYKTKRELAEVRAVKKALKSFHL